MVIKNQRILVTGINDMVGHHLLNMLRSMGATVSGIGDLHGDIGSLTYLENEILRLSPNLIFHVPGSLPARSGRGGCFIRDARVLAWAG